ncbi:hypothetical protein [Streptomyces chartreusis]|uniref:hypothetical protein n=1 Tax=Streptomyces chartreusis TaxID=1969 RepID=UPI003664E615
MKRRLMNLALVSAGSVGLILPLANVAHAGANGACIFPEVCLYYNSNLENAYFPQAKPIPNYAGYNFMVSDRGPLGAGQPVKNNAASIYNSTRHRFFIFYNSNYSCAVACQTIQPLSGTNLNSTMKNQNASGYEDGS